MPQHDLPILNSATLDQGAIGGAIGNADGRPLGKADIVGEGQQGRRIAAHLFRITIGPGIFAHRAGGVDPIARCGAADPFRHRENGAGGIAAGDEGQCWPDGVNSGADIGFHRVDADGFNLHHRLAGAGTRSATSS